jgi:hypothetical protein
VSQARGDVICFLDDDDTFSPSKLAWVADMFSGHPDLLYLHNGCRLIDPSSRPIPTYGIPRRWRVLHHREVRRGITKSREVAQMAHARGDYNASSISVARRLFDGPLGGLESVIATTDSYLFFAAIASEGSMILDPEQLTGLRIHGANASGEASRSEADLARLLPSVLERHVADYRRFALALGPQAEPEVSEYLHWAVAGARVKSVLCNPDAPRGAAVAAMGELIREWNHGTLRETLGLGGLGTVRTISPSLGSRLFSVFRHATAIKTYQDAS